jgi:hypothetical protein
MPETPDFESIALNALGLVSLSEDPLVETGRAVMVERIAEQLRLAWNARGAADIARLDSALSAVMGALARPYVKNLDRELRKLDR